MLACCHQYIALLCFNQETAVPDPGLTTFSRSLPLSLDTAEARIHGRVSAVRQAA